MKLILALILGFVFVTSPVMAEDGEKPEKKEKTEKKKKKKEKKKLPPELVEKRKELMAKVKAGDMTKEEAKAAFKALLKEHKENAAKKEGGEKEEK